MIETKFKDSELGPIPEDWEVAPLCEFFLFGNGYTPSKEVESFWKGGTIPWFRMEDIREHGRILFDSIQHITPLGVKGKLFPSGSFILSTTATIGEHAWLIADSLANQRFTFLTKGKSLKPILSEFFFYKLYEIGDWCRSNVSTNTLMAVNIKELKEYPLSLPPTETEQKRIAEVLSDVDALIKELDALIEKKRMVLKATMQDLLTARRRLPGFSEPWQEVKLGDVSTIFRGGSPRPIEKYLTQSVNGYNWIKIGDVKIGEKYITKTQERIIPQGINYTRLVNPGDFILSNSMSFGRPYILKICGCIHDGWLAISEYSNYFDTEYLYYLLGSDLTYKQYCTLAAGSGVLNLNKALVSCIILRAPRNLSEQRAIAEVLSDIDSEIAELEKKKEKYTSIRQGMMQQLLTGKIRLI